MRNSPAFTFDAESHLYRLDDVVIPSVTQVIEGNDLIDFSFIDPFFLTRAKNFGTAVHKACELICKDTLDWPRLDPNLKPYAEQFRTWLAFRGVEVLHVEILEYCPIYRYAGTIDIVCKIKGVIWIVDIKTSKTPSKTWQLQTAAYKRLIEKTMKRRKFKRAALMLNGSDPLPKWIPHNDDKEDDAAFLGCLNLLNWRIKNGTKYHPEQIAKSDDNQLHERS